MSDPSTPNRFGPAQVRRWMPTIHNIVDNWPSALTISPASWPPGIRSTETASCRLRDAIRGYIYHSPNLIKTTYYKRLTPIFDDIVVRVIGSDIQAGPRSLLQSQPALPPTLPGATSDAPAPTLTVTNPSQTALEALITLHVEQVLTTPTTITIDPDGNRQLDDNQINEIHSTIHHYANTGVIVVQEHSEANRHSYTIL